MPIQRQSEQFSIFDDGPRFQRERGSRDLPKGLAALINTSGPRISAGLLNTREAASVNDFIGPPYEEDRRWGTSREGSRTASGDCEYCGKPGHGWDTHPEAHRDVADWEREKHGLEFPFGDHREGDYPTDDDHDGSYWPGRSGSRVAVNTEGMDPNEHAYGGGAGDPLFGEFGHDGYDYEGVSRGDFNHRMRGYDPEEASALRREEIEDEDDESGYNWGPVPPEHYGSRHPFDRAAARRLANEGVEPWMDPEEFIKYHNNYFGKESDPTTQDNIRGMSEHGLHSYWQDLENNRGRSPEQLAEEREQSRAKAKEMADGLWNAFFPPEEEEGRRAVQNIDTVNNLVASGWRPEHIHYDEDDQPYALYQHPSGWTVTDRGGMYKNIGHVATPGEAHDVINVSRHDRDSGESYNAPFGPADAHAHIEDKLHGDPEETGGTLQYLTQNHPRIRDHRPRQAAKDGGCTCWEGYERVPGTEPCASGSCRKKTGQRAHDVPWEQTDEGWEHPVSGERIVRSEDYPGQWQLLAPTATKPAKNGVPAPQGYAKLQLHEDPQVLMDWHGYTHGGPAPDWHTPRWYDHMFPPQRLGPRTAAILAQMSYEDAMKHIDDVLALNYPPLRPRTDHLALRTAEAAPVQDPAAMVPVMPQGGGFMPAHRVGLPWRDSVIPGTVIGIDGPNVNVRWDDGQYSTEEPHNIQLL